MKNLAIAPKTSSRLVFVDTAIDDFYNLVLGVIPNTEIVVLHPSEDGISQITLALKEYTQVSSLHIVSHGTPGCLRLGNTVLSLDSLSQSANQLRQWRQALSADANLLLYGCNVAAGETGESVCRADQAACGRRNCCLFKALPEFP